MTQYINKSALVAEINKRIIDSPINNIGHQRVWAYNDVKDIIDTLEVKEVDLEKENFIKKEIGYIKGYREKAIKMLDELKAQKGE